jgi:serine/threonine protein kinase
MTNLLALSGGTELVGDYRSKRVLGAGGFGITYLADEVALARQVTIKEYFPVDYAMRLADGDAVPRSQDCAGDYKWGLDRFIEEAQTLARFDHPNIVRVYRYFEAHRTAYMVLRFEEGKSFKAWIKELNRAPRQHELDQIVAPLLDALEVIHKGNFLHRDIAPDNIMIRQDRAPVLIDFGSARGDIASHSRTVSALVKPGYSPYEQYATTTSQQGPWTDIYALGATLYHSVTGKRPPDAPSRMVNDEYVPAREAAIGSYRAGFLAAIDRALRREPGERPQSIAAWRGPLLAPEEKPKARFGLGARAAEAPEDKPIPPVASAQANGPPQPDVPSPPGQMLDYVDAMRGAAPTPAGKPALQAPTAALAGSPAPQTSRHGIGYGAAPAAGARAEAPGGGLLARLGQVVVEPSAAPKKPDTAVPMPIRKPRTPLWRRLTFFARPPWRGLLFKFGVGVAVASLVVSYQGQQRSESTSPASTVTEPMSRQSVPKTAIAAPPVQQVAPPAPVQPALTQLSGARGPVLALSFRAQGRLIVATSSDGMLKIWDGEAATPSRSIALGPSPIAAALASGQALTAQHDGTLIITDTEKGDRIAIARRAQAQLTAAAFGDEPVLTAAGTADGHVVVWDRTSPTSTIVESEETHTGAVSVLRVVPGRGQFVSGGEDRTVRLWSADQASLERTYRGHGSPISALEVSPSGRTLASGAADGQIRIWSTSSSRTRRSIRAHSGKVGALAFAPSGDVLASTGADATVKVWDLRRGRAITTLRLQAGPARALAFSPDARGLAIAGDDGIVRLWDLSALKASRE